MHCFCFCFEKKNKNKTKQKHKTNSGCIAPAPFTRVFFKFSYNIRLVYTYRKYVLHILLQKVHILLQKATNQTINPPKTKLLGLQVFVFKDESLITYIFITVNNNNNNNKKHDTLYGVGFNPLRWSCLNIFKACLTRSWISFNGGRGLHI